MGTIRGVYWIRIRIWNRQKAEKFTPDKDPTPLMVNIFAGEQRPRHGAAHREPRHAAVEAVCQNLRYEGTDGEAEVKQRRRRRQWRRRR